MVEDGAQTDASSVDGTAGAPDAGEASPCPADMRLVDMPTEDVCMDLLEAPNTPGELPFVMFTFDQAEDWCQARGKRLCFNDEWTMACGGPDAWLYPYHATVRTFGVCNDEEGWLPYNDTTLGQWPYSASDATVTSFDEQIARTRAAGKDAAADHILYLNMAEGGGVNAGCLHPGIGVYDLLGNIEEWTRRRDGGTTGFHGALKGRFWNKDDPRNCQGTGVLSHADAFRFYEIGFRCCQDAP